MVLWKIKKCPKCGGDIFLDIDGQTWFDHCLQCGYVGKKSDEPCPKCGGEVYLDAGRYCCRQCGRSTEAYQVSA
ncbi:MAG: hypothetical protein KAI14_05385 [Dehalococcoidales bacterium]|nr:hypothetical protein [Dehalococcoidales bacterium]